MLKEESSSSPVYNFPMEMLKKSGGELNGMIFRNHLLEFAIDNRLPVREVFKQFVTQHYLESKHITEDELLLFAYRVSSKAKLEYGLQLIVFALGITQDTAAKIIPTLFPNLSTTDMNVMGAVWEMEDWLGWPRGTTYPQVKTWNKIGTSPK